MQIKKSQQASLEDKKIVYVLMGFIFVLSLCYIALEWTEKEVTKYEVVDEDFLIEEEVEIQQTTQETPPPPPPPVVQEVEVLNVVEDDVETESIEISTEDNKEEVVIAAPVEAPEEEEEEEVVFVVVESMPEFPGGQQAMMRFIAESIKYPVTTQNGVQGRAICQYIIDKDGRVTDAEIVRSTGDAALDKEVIRVVLSMPAWIPGMQKGKPVRVKYTLPINFRLGYSDDQKSVAPSNGSTPPPPAGQSQLTNINRSVPQFPGGTSKLNEYVKANIRYPKAAYDRGIRGKTVVEFLVDVLKLASLNTPDSLSNSFSMLGALILGDFAVQAGWLGPEVLVYMAFVSVAGFAQPSYELGYAFKLLRVVLLLLTAAFDFWGLALGTLGIVLLLVTTKPLVGKGYLYPLFPFNGRALRRLLILGAHGFIQPFLSAFRGSAHLLIQIFLITKSLFQIHIEHSFPYEKRYDFY
mgnify:CR=1 FL=1